MGGGINSEKDGNGGDGGDGSNGCVTGCDNRVGVGDGGDDGCEGCKGEGGTGDGDELSSVGPVPLTLTLFTFCFRAVIIIVSSTDCARENSCIFILFRGFRRD